MLYLLKELYKKLEDGYFKDKPPYTFEKEELYTKYILGLEDKESYEFKKFILECKTIEALSDKFINTFYY